jgi:hypothetical protein
LNSNGSRATEIPGPQMATFKPPNSPRNRSAASCMRTSPLASSSSRQADVSTFRPGNQPAARRSRSTRPANLGDEGAPASKNVRTRTG